MPVTQSPVSNICFSNVQLAVNAGEDAGSHTSGSTSDSGRGGSSEDDAHSPAGVCLATESGTWLLRPTSCCCSVVLCVSTLCCYYFESCANNVPTALPFVLSRPKKLFSARFSPRSCGSSPLPGHALHSMLSALSHSNNTVQMQAKQ